MARILRQKIAYLEQRGDELEALLFAIVRRAKERGQPVEMPLIKSPVKGEAFITDLTSGELHMRLLSV